jgi:hypothetical protein
MHITDSSPSNGRSSTALALAIRRLTAEGFRGVGCLHGVFLNERAFGGVTLRLHPVLVETAIYLRAIFRGGLLENTIPIRDGDSRRASSDKSTSSARAMA